MRYELAKKLAYALYEYTLHDVNETGPLLDILYVADHCITVLPLKLRRLVPLLRRYAVLSWHDNADEKYAVATKIFHALDFYVEYIKGKGDLDENGRKKSDKETFTSTVISDCYRDRLKHIVDGKTVTMAKGLLH